MIMFKKNIYLRYHLPLR